MRTLLFFFVFFATGCATNVGPCSQIDYSLTIPAVPFFSEVAFRRQVTDDWCDLDPGERSALKESPE